MTICRTSAIAYVATALALAVTPAAAKVCSNQTFVGNGKADAKNGQADEATKASKDAAVSNWTGKVEAALGDAWIALNLAANKSLKCRRNSYWEIECEFSARPCKPGFVFESKPDKPRIQLQPRRTPPGH